MGARIASAPLMWAPFGWPKTRSKRGQHTMATKCANGGSPKSQTGCQNFKWGCMRWVRGEGGISGCWAMRMRRFSIKCKCEKNSGRHARDLLATINARARAFCHWCPFEQVFHLFNLEEVCWLAWTAYAPIKYQLFLSYVLLVVWRIQLDGTKFLHGFQRLLLHISARFGSTTIFMTFKQLFSNAAKQLFK